MSFRPTFYSSPFSKQQLVGDPPIMQEITGISLQFNDQPISRGIFKRFKRVCNNNMVFGQEDDEKLRKLMQEARVEKHIDIQQARSIRNLLIRQYNITNTYRIKENIEKIAEKYAKGIDIIDISDKLILSPYIVFQYLMIYLESIEERSEMHNKLNLISLNQARAEDILSKQDAEQFLAVREFDCASTAIQLKIMENANRCELNFINFLRNELGIQLKTQEQLFEEAIQMNKRPITPDALFLSPVEINGHPVNWIEFKSYCGAPVSFLARNIVNQYSKYKEAFGPGFIIYEYGFVEPPACPAISARALQDIINVGIQHVILV